MSRKILLFLVILIGAILIIKPVHALWIDEQSYNSFSFFQIQESKAQEQPQMNQSSSFKVTDTYTYNSETYCVDNICITYIGWSYALDSDGKWKTIDQAKSLKNSSVKCSVNSDGKDLAACLDWNTTSITVNLTTTSSLNVVPIPVKVWIPNYTNSFDYHKGILLSNISVSVTKASSTVQTLPFGLGDVLEYGANSTTITLNETNGGNVGDSYVSQIGTALNYNYGISTTLFVRSYSTNKRTFILWNLSVIPVDATITNANLSLYVGSGTSGRYINAYNTSLYNSTGAGPWVEGTLNGVSCGSNCKLTQNITWNNQPNYTMTLQDSVNITGTIRRIYWNVTNATISSFSNATNKNMSIMLKDNIEGGASPFEQTFSSKEAASNRPQLVITYIAGDSTPPIYSLNSTNSTVAGTLVQHNLKWTDETTLSGYIFSFDNCTGEFVNNTWAEMTGVTNWSNVTKIVNSTIGCTIQWCVYANDTSNNWNSTSCANPFSLTTSAGQIYNVTFQINSKGYFTQPINLLSYVRFSNFNSNELINLNKEFSLNRFYNINSKNSNQFNRNFALIKYLNVNSKEIANFIRNFNLIDWFNSNSNGTSTYQRKFILISLLNINSKQQMNFYRIINVTRFLNQLSKSNLTFDRIFQQGVQMFERFLNMVERGSNQFVKIIAFIRFSNINSKQDVDFLRTFILQTFFNQKSKGNLTFTRTFQQGLQTFERFLNMLEKGSDQFIRSFVLNRFSSINSEGEVNFTRMISLIDFFNPKSKGTVNISRSILFTKILNANSKGNLNFNSIESLSRILNVNEKQLMQFIGELPYGIFERILSIPAELIFNYLIYIRQWNEVRSYDVCSVLQQIGDSRAYLCVYDTGEWRILIKGM